MLGTRGSVSYREKEATSTVFGVEKYHCTEGLTDAKCCFNSKIGEKGLRCLLKGSVDL